MEKNHAATAAGLRFVLSQESDRLNWRAREVAEELLGRAVRGRQLALKLIAVWQRDVLQRATLEANLEAEIVARYMALTRKPRHDGSLASDQ